MTETAISTNNLSLENIISTVIQIPGVKVDRNKFLAETFASNDIDLNGIIKEGPVEFGIDRETLNKIANKLILTRTSESSFASFVAGIPGGFAMAASIPMDVMQFFGMAFRLAQELSYVYGAQDLWVDGEIDDERVRNQLILYCGVMYGIAGANAGVRLLTSQLAKTALKKLPQKALTKTFWYPLIKQIGKAFSIKVTKSTVAKGVSKAIPLIGGVISGSLNFASMMPMAKRLHSALDTACFDYTEEAMNSDYEELNNIGKEDNVSEKEEKKSESKMKANLASGFKHIGSGISELNNKVKNKVKNNKKDSSEEDVIASIERLMKLKEMGAITEEEFAEKKAELLARL